MAVDALPATVEGNFEMTGDDAGEWDPAECKLICWLQDVQDDRIVYQAGSLRIDEMATETAAPAAAAAFRLGACYPNPFNPETRIPLTLDAPASLRLELLEAGGRRVALLHHGPLDAGAHLFRWDGRDDAGRPLAGGLYLLRCAGDRGTEVRKLMLLK